MTGHALPIVIGLLTTGVPFLNGFESSNAFTGFCFPLIHVVLTSIWIPQASNIAAPTFFFWAACSGPVCSILCPIALECLLKLLTLSALRLPSSYAGLVGCYSALAFF